MIKKIRPYFYLLPSFAVILGVILIPLLYAVFISFIDLSKNVNKLDNPNLWHFIGLENYIKVLTGDFFWSALGKTLYFTVTSVGLEFIIGLAIASFSMNSFAEEALSAESCSFPGLSRPS
ncbi:carbohydrate ABC transporter permease [Aneurinibacillus tyrosinisolvens]|uniref:carbohydrate ABC transporter permease n=1 Tax=Aneurinibacillus tyrosinisolvens TaxID=1443435 RepID=UPI00069C6C12|nr:sugar ABC transporter permease [Aneurinibacillus tyrosinisolvens]